MLRCRVQRAGPGLRWRSQRGKPACAYSEQSDRAGALADPIDRAVVLVRDAQPQVAYRRAWRELKVTVSCADAAASRHHGQRIACVLIWIPHPATVEEERVIE